MFIFAVGNGLCEAVVNPLTATLFPKNKTHYLNILHAGWPAGLVLGSVASALMAAKTDDGGNVVSAAIDWKIQMSLFLIPVLAYGVMLFGQKFPKSEAADAGVSTGSMVATLFAPLMLCLLVIHMMVGYVELGTDSWIAKITGAIMASPTKGLILFSYTSSLMFALRFFAGPIVHRHFATWTFVRKCGPGCDGFNIAGRCKHGRNLCDCSNCVCPGKNIPVADDARSGFGAVPEGRGDCDWHAGWLRNALCRTAWRPCNRFPAGL